MRSTLARAGLVVVLALSAGAASFLLGAEPERDGGGVETHTIPHPEQDIFVGEVLCPVVRMENGEPYPYKAPCRQERDALDRNVARIYNADGVLIGGSTL